MLFDSKLTFEAFACHPAEPCDLAQAKYPPVPRVAVRGDSLDRIPAATRTSCVRLVLGVIFAAAAHSTWASPDCKDVWGIIHKAAKCKPRRQASQ